MKARLTSELLSDRGTPACPHCGESMCDVTLTLADLVEHWPPPRRIEVGADGYAHGHQCLVVCCGRCACPSAVAVDWKAFKLVAMRTEKDDRYLAGRVP